MKIGDFCKTNAATYSPKENWAEINYLDTGNITENHIAEIQHLVVGKGEIPSRARRKVQKEDIVYSTVRPNQLHYGIITEPVPNMLVSTGFVVVTVDRKIADPYYMYFFLTQKDIVEQLQAIGAQSTSAYPSIKPADIENIDIVLPPLNEQKAIGRLLWALEEKAATNQKLNDNLEQQLAILFNHTFAEDIAVASTETCPMLGDLITIIDNRGKTPPLTTEIYDYPIIDVGALKGAGRIVDFNNCTKYVEKSTYETWFRSGHPKPWDILISTVGSLAEMKIYLGSKGCMAQNVVAFRATSISPLYLYQYLRFIRADLVAYNIGSVQPSIKVTHIVKHPVFVPESPKLANFEEAAKAVTNQLYANYTENEALKELRDTLLTKLMSGELDVSTLDI